MPTDHLSISVFISPCLLYCLLNVDASNGQYMGVEYTVKFYSSTYLASFYIIIDSLKSMRISLGCEPSILTTKLEGLRSRWTTPDECKSITINTI